MHSDKLRQAITEHRIVRIRPRNDPADAEIRVIEPHALYHAKSGRAIRQVQTGVWLFAAQSTVGPV